MDKEQFLVTDRPAASVPTEDESEVGWAEFQSLVGKDLRIAPSFHDTDSSSPDFRVAIASMADGLVRFATSAGRVCPMPAEWAALYEVLRSHDASGSLPPPPIEGIAWTSTSARTKKMCLQVHIEWAADHQALELVERFLHGLPGQRWHVLGQKAEIRDARLIPTSKPDMRA